MKIISLSLKKETENYKYFSLHYTPWYDSESLKIRDGFVFKPTNDCFWEDNGDSLSARAEMAVLAKIEWHENHPF
jgi:hypothetical protein